MFGFLFWLGRLGSKLDVVGFVGLVEVWVGCFGWVSVVLCVGDWVVAWGYSL